MPKLTELQIRPEKESDHTDIDEVNRLAFGRENEARLVRSLRSGPGFDPELSLVAIQDQQIVGHILFSLVDLQTAHGRQPILSLAPMAVRPEYQNQGIGSELVHQGLEACRRGGHTAVIVLGHADFYSRFGFTPARPKGIHPPFEVSDEVWMVAELTPGGLEGLQGRIHYPAAFEDV